MSFLPEQLLNSLEGLPGFQRQDFIRAHDDPRRVTSIRLNPFKKTEAVPVTANKVPWCEEGYYLDERPSFTLDPLFHAGCYYVQEAGSMMVEQMFSSAFKGDEPIAVLDLCASPGGKSTHLNSLISRGSLLVSNEIVKGRAAVLAQNLARWGTSNTVVTNNEAGRFTALEGYFDMVLVDAPCSGSGLFRKQPEAVDHWSVSSVTACSIRQKNILSDVLPAVKPGGYLAYSTCSYSEEENEQIVKWLQNEYGMEFVPLEIPQQWPVVASGAGYRLYPHLADSEGFFCALLRRTGGENGSSRMKKKIIRPDRKEEPVLQKWISAADDVIIKKNDQFHMMTLAVAQFFSEHEKTFYFKKAGTVMGEIKGRDFIPNQELAWSIKLSADVPAVELEKSEALKYLRKEAFLPGSDKSGLCLITHKNFGLGWAKILSNRTNNYLPNELRIFK